MHYLDEGLLISSTQLTIVIVTTQSNRRIYIHKAFIDELKIWKSNQAELSDRFTNNTSSLQIFQASPEVPTAPNVSNFRSNFKKECLKI